VIRYEHPLNERVRTMLRLEDLCARVFHFLEQQTRIDHHACLIGIFEILEVASRADLKSDLLQELERQRSYLSQLRSNPDVALDRLNQVLAEIDSAYSALYAANGKTGQELRENEWLMSIKQRANIPGGACEFDLPSYHYWMNRGPADRRQDLQMWMRPLIPTYNGVSVVLRVLRESGKTFSSVARQGVFQQIPMDRPAQLLRVVLSPDYACVPEISANKYALNIRFLRPDSNQKSRLFEGDVPFELTFCNL
jgi:cell division protein ZapD